MAKFKFNSLLTSQEFYIVKADIKVGDAYMRHRDLDQDNTDYNKSIGFVINGEVTVYYHDGRPAEIYGYGQRSPRIMDTPSYSITCSQDGDYWCIHHIPGYDVIGELKALEPGESIDSTSQYVYIPSGSVSVDGKVHNEHKLLILTSPKTITCVKKAVVIYFDVFEDKDYITK